MSSLRRSLFYGIFSIHSLNFIRPQLHRSVSILMLKDYFIVISPIIRPLEKMCINPSLQKRILCYSTFYISHFTSSSYLCDFGTKAFHLRNTIIGVSFKFLLYTHLKTLLINNLQKIEISKSKTPPWHHRSIFSFTVSILTAGKLKMF